MKAKISTLLFFILLVMIDVSAQTKIGIRTGLNFGNLNHRNESVFNHTTGAEIIYGNTDIRLGFIAGGFLDYSITENTSIQAGFYYIRKGNTRHATELEEDIVTSIKINNIDFPVHLKYKFVFNEKFSAFAMAGPYVGYLHSTMWRRCKGNICETNGLLFIPEYDDYDDLEMHRLDAGLSIGTGISFKKLFVDFRYVTGSQNIWRHGVKVTTKGFQIGVGCFFN